MTKTNESTSVNAITKQFKSSGGKYTHKGYGYKQPSTQSKCWNCGGQWPHPGGRQSCPAHGKTCANCAKQNHFAQHCRQPRNKRIVNMVAFYYYECYSFFNYTARIEHLITFNLV